MQLWGGRHGKDQRVRVGRAWGARSVPDRVDDLDAAATGNGGTSSNTLSIGMFLITATAITSLTTTVTTVATRRVTMDGGDTRRPRTRNLSMFGRPEYPPVV